MIPGFGASGEAGPGVRARRPGRLVVPVLLGAFGVFGLFWGSFAVLLADLSGALDLSPGPLGVALFVGAAASIMAMAVLGWTSDRLGRRLFLVLSGGTMGLGIAALAFVGGYAALLAALVVLYAASGLYDVGINAAAVDLEKAAARRFMTVLHAAFSAGGVAGALSAGALLSAGVDYRYAYLALLLPLGAVILAVATTRFPPPGEPPGGSAPAEGSGLYRSLPLLLIAVIATLALLSEGEMEHWSGVYLRNTLGLSALLGGSGVAVIYGSMAVGRLGAAFVIGRLGNRPTLLPSPARYPRRRRTLWAPRPRARAPPPGTRRPRAAARGWRARGSSRRPPAALRLAAFAGCRGAL